MFDFLLRQKERQILHVDADAFFATVEQVLNPKLKGKPVLVGGPTDKKGIVSAASYEARKYGIYSGMPMYLAKRSCPKAIVIPGNFDAYREFSKRMYVILSNFAPRVEMASIDEAYVDISGLKELYKNDYPEIAKDLIIQIYKKIGISISGGLASNKTVAKVASSTNKPHKLTVIPYGKEKDFLSQLSLRCLPGIGPKTFSTLERRGFEKIGQLSNLNISEILNIFGQAGIPLWKKSQGIDNTEVISSESLPKSISKEHTFYEPVTDTKTCLKNFKNLSTTIFQRLRYYGMKAQVIFVKVRYNDYENGKRIFKDFSFQKHLDSPSSLDNKLFPVAKNLLLNNVNLLNYPVRLIGLGVSNLIKNYNLSLFEDDEEEKLFFEIDKIKRLYGEECIKYGV